MNAVVVLLQAGPKAAPVGVGAVDAVGAVTGPWRSQELAAAGMMDKQEPKPFRGWRVGVGGQVEAFHFVHASVHRDRSFIFPRYRPQQTDNASENHETQDGPKQTMS